MHWRMALEEFGPKFEHVKGQHNVVADALSQLPLEWHNKDLEEVEDPIPQLSCVTGKGIEDEQFPMLPTLIGKHQ